MNPISLLEGGMSGGSIAPDLSSTSGDASGEVSAGSSTGAKNISFGGSKNAGSMAGVLSNPLVLLAVVAVAFLALKR